MVFVISLFVIVAAFNPGLFGIGERIEIPELLGKTLEEAQEICAEKGFVIEGETGDYSDKYAEGQIMEQTPSAGMHKKVETITVKFSRGLTKFTLEDYTGSDVNAVKNDLRKLGIDVVIEETQHDTMPVDTVVRHSPSGGSTIKSGSTVTLYVSSGKEDIRVPSITGISLERAKVALEAVGLEIGEITYVEDVDMIDKVIAQTILEGTEVKTGTAVDVKVGKAPEETSRPDEGNADTPTTTPDQPETGAVSR